MIEKPWGVAVFGAASVKAAPDVARVRLSVVLVRQTPKEALATASVCVHDVREALRRLGLNDDAVQQSQLHLKTAYDGYGESRKFLGYRCTASFSVTLTDLDGLDQLLIDVVAAGANEVEGVEFDVLAKPELRARARQEAVEAAQRKARLYADAAGVRLGVVVHIEDIDPDKLEQQYRGHGGGGATSGDDFAPGHVVVKAAVTLGLSIAHD